MWSSKPFIEAFILAFPQKQAIDPHEANERTQLKISLSARFVEDQVDSTK
jgi:hypothetical protein